MLTLIQIEMFLFSVIVGYFVIIMINEKVQFSLRIGWSTKFRVNFSKSRVEYLKEYRMFALQNEFSLSFR